MFAHHGLDQKVESIEQTLLPAKSKACRSYSSNNQSLDQIMKKANEIIRKSKITGTKIENGSQSLQVGGDSFFTLTTADSLQKNGALSTNREGNRISPQVTAASPDITDQEYKVYFTSSSQEQTICDEENEGIYQNNKRNSKVQQNQGCTKPLTEADFFFENFDKLIKVVVVNSSTEIGSQYSTSVIKSLVSTFDKIKKEEQQIQLQPPQQQQNNLSNYQRTSFIEQNSYLIPKPSPQMSASPYLLPPMIPTPTQGQIQMQTQSSNNNESIDQYLIKPQQAKVKSSYPAHPPLPHHMGRGSITQQPTFNQANSSQYRQRHSLRDKENNSSAANSSFNNHNGSYCITNLNNSNDYISSIVMSSSNNEKQTPTSFLFTTPTAVQNPRSIQPQGNQNHLRSCSYVIEQPSINQQQITKSRPRSDSSDGTLEAFFVEPHLRSNGTYAPLKGKGLVNSSGETPTQYRVNMNTSSNSSANGNNFQLSATQKFSMQLSNSISTKQSGDSKNAAQSNLLSNLMQGVQRQIPIINQSVTQYKQY